MRNENRNLSIEDLNIRLTKEDVYQPGENIQISSDFQRGDEENGVWNDKQRSILIDSIQQSYPIGSVIFIRDFNNAMATYNEPWNVLDGGNRCRAIRDFINNKLKNMHSQFYSELDIREQIKFENVIIPCIWVTVERNDHPSTIANMFARLNTSSSPLSNGELVKAHGWKNNVIEIEMAKALIGDAWNDDLSIAELSPLREKWENVFGKLGETKRCDSMVMMCAFIVSAKESDFHYFEKKYATIHPKFSNPYDEHDANEMTDEKIQMVIQKLNSFLDLIDEIPRDNLGKNKKGMPSKSKIAPLWKNICEGTMTSAFRDKLIAYFQALSTNSELRIEYENELTKNGDNHTSYQKIDRVLQMIEEW